MGECPQGEFEKGIAEIQEGLEKIRATAAFLFEPFIPSACSPMHAFKLGVTSRPLSSWSKRNREMVN